jgi:hypothetical protein
MSKQRARERKKKRKACCVTPPDVQAGDFVVVDQQGNAHPLGPEIFGDDWPRAQQYLAEIDRSTLPSVKEAQQKQAVRYGAKVLPPGRKPGR